MTEIVDFMGFVWSIISGFVETIKNVIDFIIDLITTIPEFLSFLPNEILIVFIPVISIIFIIFIYSFVK